MQRHKSMTGHKFNYHVVMMRNVTDPRQQRDSHLRLARSCLEWLQHHGKKSAATPTYVAHLKSEARARLASAHALPTVKLP